MTTCRIAVVALSAAALFGLAGVNASAAQATVVAPASVSASVSAPVVFMATDPPGPCLSSEIGRRKRGPDGRMYECKVLRTYNT